jgi:hypothetical protein
LALLTKLWPLLRFGVAVCNIDSILKEKCCVSVINFCLNFDLVAAKTLGI